MWKKKVRRRSGPKFLFGPDEIYLLLHQSLAPSPGWWQKRTAGRLGLQATLRPPGRPR